MIKFLKIISTPLVALIWVIVWIALFIWWDVLVKLYNWTWGE